MTTTAIAYQRTALVTLLTAMTTATGAAFSTVSASMPTLAPAPGSVECWVTLDGYDAMRREGGFYGHVEYLWRWGITLAIWQIDDPATMAATENDFAQAVTDLIATHYRGGVDPVATGVNILNSIPGDMRASTIDLDGSYFRLLEWHLALEQQAVYNLTQ